MKKKLTIVLAAALLTFAPAARGAGFLIYEHGAVAMAMGGAFTAVANDPSAIWHNPAGLSWVEGTQVLLGGTFIFPRGSVTMPDIDLIRPDLGQTFNQSNQVFTPPNIYISHRFTDRVTAGIGFMAPFGLGTKWSSTVASPPAFPLSYLGYNNDMKTFFVNPTIAVKLLDNLSVGFGCSYIFSDLTLDLYQRVVLPPPPAEGLPYDVPTAMKGSGDSFNFNAGVLYKGKGFSLGATYRSRFNIKYSGTVALDNQFVPAILQAYIPPEGTVTTTFKFPAILTFGLAVDISQKLLWSFDFHTYFWGRFDSYTADIVFPAPYPPETLTAVQNWKDSHCTRMGFQYQANDKLTLRLGGFYDETPQPVETMDPNLPDNDRWAITGGVGYKIGKFTFNLAYHFEHFLARTSQHDSLFPDGIPPVNPFAGTYKTQAHLVGINLGYSF